MLDTLFGGILETGAAAPIEVQDFFLCVITSIALGFFMAMMYVRTTKCTKGFALTLAVLPLAIAIVILMVNGSIGAGVAVAGAFSLVRFRSVPGTAKEITAIFTALCTGLTVGMGYIGFAILFAVIASVLAMVLLVSNFGEPKSNQRVIYITIPENLNYTHVFDDIMVKYTEEFALASAKSISMGSLFKLRFDVALKDVAFEKDMIDDLRCRNGNLEIMISKDDSTLHGL